MVFFNYATMQMAAKIVYYGPGLCGKTTNLQYIYQKTSPKSRGEMVSLETETDRTLFFDLLPLDVGNIAGFKTRFQLYTVPGQVFYNSTRKLVLRGVDGIVFVADSQVPMMEANLESLGNLRANLAELGLNLDDVPLVLQYNKRDLKNVASVEELNRRLNPKNLPSFEASALQGNGVFETLKGISKATLITLRRRALGEDRMRTPDVLTKPMPQKEAAAVAAAAVSQGPAPAMSKPATFTPPPPPPSDPVPVIKQTPSADSQSTQPPAAAAQQAPPEERSAPLMAAATQPSAAEPQPTAAEIAKEKVEFAQISGIIPKPDVKKIAVKTSDIATKLDTLRDIYTGKSDSPKDKKEQPALDPLMALLGSKEKKPLNKKLKIKLEPHELEIVKTLALDFHLTGENVHKKFSNAVTVALEGKSNPKRVVLKIELEIVKK